MIITNPFNPAADIKVPFMVKAASIPSFTVGQVPIQYFGWTYKVPGDRTWEDWNTTVYNDEDFVVRNSLEQWSNAMKGFQTNIAGAGADPTAYKSTALVTHFGKAGDELRIYQLNGIFPVSVSAIDLDWGSNDAMEEFQVTWAFDDLQVVGGITGDSSF